MNAFSGMDDHDPLGEIPRYTAPFSVFTRSVEETQGVSVIPSGCLWEDSLVRMIYEDASIIYSSACIAQEGVEKVALVWKADSLRRLFNKWREEDDEEDLQETLEYSSYFKVHLCSQGFWVEDEEGST